MRPVSDLIKLKEGVSRRVLHLRRAFNRGQSGSDAERDALFAFCAIELDNLVLASMRVFVISSLWSARSVSGKRVTCTFVFWSEGEIAAFMLSVIRPNSFDRRECPPSITRNNEITVRDPRDLEKVLVEASASNIGSWQSALAANFEIFRDLCVIRNFYAHRNKDTWQKVRRKAQELGATGVARIDDFMIARVPGRPLTFFENWLDEADTFFDLCTY